MSALFTSLRVFCGKYSGCIIMFRVKKHSKNKHINKKRLFSQKENSLFCN